MKRRTFGLLAGGSLLAVQAGVARAQIAQASSLGAGLTPMGSEVAGNEDGSIPAWTGGLTSLPAGINVITAGGFSYVPELFPNEQPVVAVDASNMADHAAQLTDGLQTMITKYGYKLKVFPTHRTAASPQYVYDNIAKNHGTAKFLAADPIGGRFGFEGAYGGVPFPVLDLSNPLTAGGQAIWNHILHLNSFCTTQHQQGWVMSSGQLSLALAVFTKYKQTFYDPNGSLATFNGLTQENLSTYDGPANLVGQAVITKYFSDPHEFPQENWQLLNGQGRVRRAPEISFDTPSSYAAGIANYDEYYGFNGSIERYDWNCVGRQEKYVPYNNNGLYAADAQTAHLDHFLDPDLVRWEKHRCWVVEATLHPGERNVLAKRRFYIDEDTWSICCVDAWDANGNLLKVNLIYNNCRPDAPGVMYGGETINNLQTDDYVSLQNLWNQAKRPTVSFADDLPESLYDPNTMAASQQY